MTTALEPAPTHHDAALPLRRLYLARFGFAAAWAVAIGLLGSSLSAATVTLLVLYPVVDAVAAVVDLRATRDRLLGLNLAISVAAAVGLAIASADDVTSALRVWGAWAVVAGVVQLVVGVRRRRLGGQWPMMLSGGISVLAGLGFLARSGDATSVRAIAGYAALGAIFFLVSAARLSRARRGTDRSVR